MSALKLDDYLPYRLSVAANAVSDLISRAYKDRYGLTTAQWRLVAVLGEDGASTQQQLCARTVMDKVTVSRAAAQLFSRHLIHRSPNADDRRSHRLDLTPAGAKLYSDVAPEALQYERCLLVGLTPQELMTVHDLLRRLESTAMTLSPDGASG